jgi:hypothetical protein
MRARVERYSLGFRLCSHYFVAQNGLPQIAIAPLAGNVTLNWPVGTLQQADTAPYPKQFSSTTDAHRWTQIRKDGNGISESLNEQCLVNRFSGGMVVLNLCLSVSICG